MANTRIFSTKTPSKKADALNRAGGLAYKLSDKAALAQYAVTGTFNGSYYTSAQVQYAKALQLAKAVPVDYLAKVAVYARKKGYMKDMPAFLLAVLATRDTNLFKQAFPLVIDNGKMLRNFVQIMRSGAVGRRSLGSASKKAIQRWFRKQSDSYVFKASVGNDPSIADVIRMVHPRPQTEQRDALYAYLTGKDYDASKLPSIVKQYEAFKKDPQDARVVPDVPFQMLTSLGLSKAEWKEIAKNGKWQFTRMNLNTFDRHDVFSSKTLVTNIAKRLKDPALVSRSRAFPMQIMASYENSKNIPTKVRNALQDAMELAVENIPDFGDKKIYVAVDSSGSMGAPATGYRKGSTSVVTCKDAAALFAACIVRKNDEAEVMSFTTSARWSKVNSRDSIMTMKQNIGQINGGTDVSCSLRKLNQEGKKGDLVFILSDMESWADPYSGRSTGTQVEWDKFRRRNPGAQLVCINLVHGSTAQATNRSDVLNVGGFSDQVFTIVDGFIKSGGDSKYWVNQIESSVDFD